MRIWPERGASSGGSCLSGGVIVISRFCRGSHLATLQDDGRINARRTDGDPAWAGREHPGGGTVSRTIVRRRPGRTGWITKAAHLFAGSCYDPRMPSRRRPSDPPPLEVRRFTPDEATWAKKLLESRMADVKALDPNTVRRARAKRRPSRGARAPHRTVRIYAHHPSRAGQPRADADRKV